MNSAFFEKKFKRFLWNMVGSKTLSASPASPRLRPGMSVLALRPDRLGDFILTIPALQRLERALGPSGRLTLVTGKRNERIARFFFPRARIFVFRKFLFSRFLLFARLRMGRFHVVVDFHSFPFSTTSALMALASRSPIRVGYWGQGEFHAWSKRVFRSGRPFPPENLHEMEKSLRLLGPLGIEPGPREKVPFKIPSVPEDIRSKVRFFYEKAGITSNDIILGIHPTLQKQDNRWPPGLYAELILKAAVLPRVKIVLVHGWGEGKDLQRFEELKRKISNLFILPSNDVLFILDAARRFDLFLCGDSGLMHLASLTTRVMAVFGPSEPRRWGPLKWGILKNQILRAKNHHCHSIGVQKVFKTIQKTLRLKKQSNPKWPGITKSL